MERILALEVRIISFGFCVLDGPDQLVDWGIRSFRRGVNRVKVSLDDKILMLLNDFLPQRIVTNSPVVEEQSIIVSKIRALAQSRHIETYMIARSTIHEVFQGHNDNKHDIASAVADQLQELASCLPAKRKTWQAEHYRMRIFDAAALGLSYFQSLPKDAIEEIPSPASH